MTGIKALALDLSLSASGIARTHASNGERRLSCYSLPTSRTPGKATVMDHRRVHRVLGEVVKAVKAGLDVAAIEWLPQFEGHGDASLRLAELGAVVRHYLWGKGVPYVDIQPGHLKIYATGTGNATKEDVAAAVVARYGRLTNVNPRDHDACDALTLLGMLLDGMGQPLPGAVPDTCRRALNGYTWPALAALPTPGGA